MLELLRSIPGPVFLFIYTCIAMLGILAAREWVGRDGSMDHRPPDPEMLDPYAIAFLRGGHAAVIQASLYSLFRKKLVHIGADGFSSRHSKMTAKKVVCSIACTGVEQQVLDAVNKDKMLVDMLGDKPLQERIMKDLEPSLAELSRYHLLRTPEDRARAWRIVITVGTVIVSIGLVKLIMGIYYDRPVFMLAVLLAVSPFALFFAANPRDVRTRLGRHFLDSLAERLAWIKTENSTKPTAIHPALGIAVFGTAILSNSIIGKYLGSGDAGAGNVNSGFGGCGGGGSGSSGGCGGGGCGGCGGGGD